MRRSKTEKLVLCALFAALTAAGAFIRIPIPVVPFTLQLLFTMLAGLLLGPYWGAAAVTVYVIMGLLGLPVFAEGGGISYVLKPSFGYLIGYIAGTFLTGCIAHGGQKYGMRRLLAANFAGLFVVYAFGMVYYYLLSNLYLGTPIGLWPLFLYCFLLAVPGDIALCVAGAVLAKRLIPLIGPYRRTI